MRWRTAHDATVAPAALSGNCPIREHTADGAYVGRCEFACYGGVCPRHGRVSDYPRRDDRDVQVADRYFGPPELARFLNRKMGRR